MKVILLSTFYKPSVGGVERQVEEIFINLKKRKIDVSVYTTDASHSSARRLKDYEQLEDVKRFKFLFGFGYFFRFSPKLVIDLLSAKFDILHVHNSHDAHLLPVILVCLLRRKKLVLTGHNPYVVDSSKRKAALSSGVRFFDFILKFFSFGINKYIALLPSEKDYIGHYLNLRESKLAVIPNGIRDDYYNQIKEFDNDNLFIKEFGINKDEYRMVFGCLCRMDFVKGIQNLTKAVENNQDCLFIFAGGDGGFLDHLKEIYKDYKNVLFTNRYLDVQESMQFYAFIDSFLLPSIYEPFGITIVEAMTQGKYIVASSNGGPKEILKEDFGEVISPLDQEAWNQAINKLKINKEAYIEKGKMAVKESYNYKWTTVIDKLIAEYKSVL